MNNATINADVTMASDGGQSLLANRYRVVKQLGQGGMGSVWLAEDTVLDNRKVAIKMLPSILFANKRAYNQLKSEALVAMKLSHPNIASVRYFEENDGNPFIVEDYIEGQTLDDYLAEKGGTLSEEETRKLLAPVAAALDYAHREGVVHRDVKPANVMIRKDGTPFILDFGIAREAQETMTMVTGKLSSGTLLYMSPEQLKGAQPKAAQDIYSFAAMAYECLSGNPPFCRGQVEYQIVNEPPPPLGPHFINCGLVMAGLAKDPAERPATCVEVLASCGVHRLADLITLTAGTPAPQAAEVKTSFKRKLLSLVCFVVLNLAVFGVLFVCLFCDGKFSGGVADDTSETSCPASPGRDVPPQPISPQPTEPTSPQPTPLAPTPPQPIPVQPPKIVDPRPLPPKPVTPDPTPGVSATEVQRCNGLIKKAFYDAWTPRPKWTPDLRKMVLSVSFDKKGFVTGYKLTQSSGDPAADNTVRAAASRVKVVRGLTEAYLRKNREVKIVFEVTPL